MNTRLCVLHLVIGVGLLLAHSSVFGGDLPRISRGDNLIYGGSSALEKAAADTVDLLGPTGSGAPYLGDFEAGWNGWTTIDKTQPTITSWQVSDYNQSVVGNLAAWCGDLSFASCDDSLDAVGGYGNSWHMLLGQRTTVANPSLAAQVTVTAVLQNDTEPGYDFTHLSVKYEGVAGYADIQTWDSTVSLGVDETFTFLPSQLIDGSDVFVAFRVISDGGWSDEDCSYPSAGACQIDDITVTVSQAGEPDLVSFTDFQDGTFGDWFIDFPAGAGDFAKLWTGLEDQDPCATNYSQQVAFIDDGLVVPGTGGTECLNWCYGPSGYIVNHSGGLAGLASHMQVVVNSPVMTWPSDIYDGMVFAFDVYRDESLAPTSPGIFYQWGVRSADTDGSSGSVQVLADQLFQDRNFVYFGDPQYWRASFDVSDLIVPGRDELQVQVSVYDLGWAFGFTGTDGTPAPYFDNISVKLFERSGPIMVADEAHLAQDNFPEAGVIDETGSTSMHVRFDMARNISPEDHLRNDPGDSITVSIVPSQNGSYLLTPTMHYLIAPNPVFDSYRTIATSGVILGNPARINGIPSPTKWAFDLPDTGGLFPGDIMRYYFRAGENLAGNIIFGTLPDDISEFNAPFDTPGTGASGNYTVYDQSFTVHALPSVRPHGTTFRQDTSVLFWNDGADEVGTELWLNSLLSIGIEWEGLDVFHTHNADEGLGNGLGGRATPSLLADYDFIIYASGAQTLHTISEGEYAGDPKDDIGLITSWLENGGQGLLLFGESLASDLATNGLAPSSDFLANVLGVDLVTSDLRQFIGNQMSPLILTVPGQPVFSETDRWRVADVCETNRPLNQIDGVQALVGSLRLAEFATTGGQVGVYPYSAATENVFQQSGRVISLPYRFDRIVPETGVGIDWPRRRDVVLEEALRRLGVEFGVGDIPAVEASVFEVNNYPNPFNPSTKIFYTIKAPGHLSLKIYNVRGELVKILIEGKVQKGDAITWSGDTDQGSDAPSGVYFYEARMGADVVINKMALIK